MSKTSPKRLLLLAVAVLAVFLLAAHPVQALTFTPLEPLKPQMPSDVREPLLPGAPGNLELSYRTDGPTWIWLKWQDNAFNETGFVVERKKGTGDFVEYATVEADRTRFIDEYPPAGTQLCYRVRAVNGLGSSAYSNEACVNTHGWYPAKPGNLTATVTPEGIRLNWTDNDDTEHGYAVFRDNGTSPTKHVASLPPDSTTCLDTEAIRGETYRYTVRCHNQRGSSGNAFTDWITFLPPQAALLENQLPLTGPVVPDAVPPPPPAAGEVPAGTAPGQAEAQPETHAEESSGAKRPGVELRFWIGRAETGIREGTSTASRLQPMDAAPLLVGARTFVPIRYVTEPLGARVDWDGAAGRATVALGETLVELRVNNGTALVNGTPQPIDSADPEVRLRVLPPGRIFVPLRFVGESLGAAVH